MRAFVPMTVANIKSFIRDRAALFWTVAFPILFVVLFGSIFSEGGRGTLSIGWADEDRSPASAGLRQAFASVPLLELEDGAREDGLRAMRDGDLDAVIVVPAGLGGAVGVPGSGGGRSGSIELAVYTDPSQSNQSTTIQQVVGQVVGTFNVALSGRPPILGVRTESLQTQDLTPAAYFVPSILAMALMQLGIFSAIPLVADRERLILKRLGATPLGRWVMVASNLAMRLLVAVVQTVLIIAVGAVLFGVTVLGNYLVLAFLVVLGAMTFISIGYLIASYARTEDTANALTSIVQFPLMFLSGIFFPLEFMPDFLQPVATVMPLTYLGDALRQVMVGGSPFVPLGVDVLVLGGWLAASFAIAARYFRWQ